MCMLQAPHGVQDAHRAEMHGGATASTATSSAQGPPTGAMRTEGGRDSDASFSSKRQRRAGKSTEVPTPSEGFLHGVSLEGLERQEGHTMPFGMDGVAPEICDMIALCNAAHSVGRGDMVWLGWNAGFAGEKKNRQTNSFSSAPTASPSRKRGLAQCWICWRSPNPATSISSSGTF